MAGECPRVAQCPAAAFHLVIGRNNRPPPDCGRLLDRPIDDGLDLPALQSEVARHYLKRGLEVAGGNKTQAAELLGLSSYQTLTNWMRKHGVPELE